MKYALIGCGRIATNHIKAAVNNKLEIAAVCDVVPENDKLLAGDYHQLSQNARRMAKNNSWELQEKSLLNIYDKLIN